MVLARWITRQGIQTLHNKVAEILNIEFPKTRKGQELRTSLLRFTITIQKYGFAESIF
jgi:hypothetical protein